MLRGPFFSVPLTEVYICLYGGLRALRVPGITEFRVLPLATADQHWADGKVILVLLLFLLLTLPQWPGWGNLAASITVLDGICPAQFAHTSHRCPSRGLPVSPLKPPLLTVVSSMAHAREVLLPFLPSSSLLSSLPLFLFETGSQYKACDDSKLSSSCLSLLRTEIMGMVEHTYLTAEFPIHFALILMKL